MLTALEAFLVSLYGFRPTDDPPALRPLGSETSSAPPEALPPEEEASLASTDLFSDADPAVRPDAPPDSQTSNGSSSSSLADDWILNQMPAGLDSNVHDQNGLLSAETNSIKLPEIPEGNASRDERRAQFSAEDWSRGTALTDPVSGRPLQPVSIHQPSKTDLPAPDGAARSADKKAPNAITEKRAALTAYDLISSRAMRAPLSPAALFEKEARAEVLREKPAAGLQDISAAVRERWKNLREEDRKK